MERARRICIAAAICAAVAFPLERVLGSLPSPAPAPTSIAPSPGPSVSPQP